MTANQDFAKEVIKEFDLSFVPAKLHIIFLFFLRMNKRLSSVKATNINLKSDMIRYLMKDFVHLTSL